MAPFNDLAIVEDSQHGTEHGKSHTLRKIRQKVLHALAFLAVRHIILVDFLKIIVDLAGDLSAPK